jgi:hypothetical protein
MISSKTKSTRLDDYSIKVSSSSGIYHTVTKPEPHSIKSASLILICYHMLKADVAFDESQDSIHSLFLCCTCPIVKLCMHALVGID